MTAGVSFLYGGRPMSPDDHVFATVYDDERRELRITCRNDSLYVLSDFKVELHGLDPSTYEVAAPRYVRPARQADIIVTIKGRELAAAHAGAPVPGITSRITYYSSRTLGDPMAEAGPAGVGTYSQRANTASGTGGRP